MAFSAIQRETLETKVYQALRTAIIEGHLARGERLVQDDLATQFGTSRIPVRDALKRIETEGLVTVDERGSYIVSVFGREDIEEIYELRMLLEPYAAGKALKHMTASDLEGLESIVHEMREAASRQDIERYVQLNQTFHLMLYELSQQRRLVRMIQGLWSGLMPLTPIAVPGQLERSVSEHDALLRALQERKQDTVEALLREHIQHAEMALKAHLATEEH
jgi:DNA-binding GntR family transcriptional regulator